MFDMFKNLGQMGSVLKNLPKLREEMEQMQHRLAQITAEGDAGAGMVKVTVNGKLELVRLTLAEDALKSGDREMLEDLIKGAVNQALGKARQAIADESGKLASNLGLPPGMNLPGLS